MSNADSEMGDRDRRSGCGIGIVVFVILLLYLISPPIIERVAGPLVWENAFARTLYFPLISLADKFDFVRTFYVWLYALFGLL